MDRIKDMLMSTKEDNTTEVEIDLTLEEWGRIALIANEKNMTINETVVYLLQSFIDSEMGTTRV